MTPHYLIETFTDMKQCTDWLNANYERGWALKDWKAVAGYGGPYSTHGPCIYVILEREEEWHDKEGA